MGRAIELLTVLEVEKAARARSEKVRKISDGGGLLLVLAKSNAPAGEYGPASWVFRFQLRGRLREMGLGSYPAVKLRDARRAATGARELLAKGIDPLDNRRAMVPAKPVAQKTFRECAKAHIAAMRPGWRNEKHAAQWPTTLEAYAYPEIGDVPVGEVTTAQVVKVLSPIWLSKNPTARRVRERIEAVLNSAKALGHREGENVAAWRGHLRNLLPRYTGAVTHHPALPFQEVGAFIADLQGQVGISPLALEFLILTATRTSEVLDAEWTEFDLDAGIWTIPAARVKTNKPHRVPLSRRALEIVCALHENPVGRYVFPGAKLYQPLSNMALLQLLHRMGRQDLTAHGFRSSFRDWAAETTSFPHEVCEMALAHAVEGKVEGAYRRGDLFEKRRILMETWAQYCATPAGGQVVPIRPAAAS